MPATCELSRTGVVFCRPVPPCADRVAGDPCLTEWGAPGICTADGGGTLHCAEVFAPCAGLAAGDACAMPDGSAGVCRDTGALGFVCGLDPCQTLPAGAACEDGFGAAGRCAAATPDGPLACRPGRPCKGRALGSPCLNLRTHGPGTCVAGAGGHLVCQTANPCDGRAAFDACEVRRGLTGVCVVGAGGGAHWCDTGRRGGGLHAVETDACGAVYVSDAGSEAVWRVAPDGSTVEVFAAIGTTPVTSLAFGSSDDGFGRDILHIVTHGGADILQVAVGTAGRPVVRPTSFDVTPAGPADDPPVDCLNLPAAPLGQTELGRPRGFHDVAFDTAGYLIGYDGSALVAVTRDDSLQLFASGLEGAEGMAFLPNDSLVVATGQGLVRIAPSGGQEILAPDIHAYGVTCGPDGKIYAGTNGTLWRVDPTTGQAAVYVDGAVAETPFAPRTIAFDRDASLMYIGTLGDKVYVLSLDANLDPVGPPRPLAVVKPGVAFRDGLAVDTCGNLYMPNYESSALFRIAPDGQVALYLQWEFAQYGHGAKWGGGHGGYRTDALYLPQPYDGNTVVEVVVGVPGQ